MQQGLTETALTTLWFVLTNHFLQCMVRRLKCSVGLRSCEKAMWLCTILCKVLLFHAKPNVRDSHMQHYSSQKALSPFWDFQVLRGFLYSHNLYCTFTPSLHIECSSMIEEQGKGSHLCVTCISVCNCSFYELFKGSRVTNINNQINKSFEREW